MLEQTIELDRISFFDWSKEGLLSVIEEHKNSVEERGEGILHGRVLDLFELYTKRI
jgi:hypothetical protein